MYLKVLYMLQNEKWKVNRYLINVPSDKQRLERSLKELNSQGYEDVKVFRAIVDKDSYKGISMSFKNIIIENYNNPMVHIFEDDVKFTSKKSMEIFDYGFSVLPSDWDIYLGGSYSHLVEQELQGLRKIENFRSLHCVVIRKSAYDMFLSHDWTASNYNNIDAWVAMKKPNVYLCNPQIAIQYNGYSHNQKAKVNYDHFLNDKNILHD